MSQVASSLWSLWIKTTTTPGEDEKNPLQLVASPGLMTLLDVALYRSNEGGLTSNICAANALLCAWIDLKQQAHALLHVLLQTDNNMMNSSGNVSQQQQQQRRRATECAESFARVCLEASSDALERLASDKLSQSASSMSETNNSNNNNNDGMNVSSTSSSGSSLLGVGSQDIAHGVAESIRTAETGRRSLPGQTYKSECWESPLLYCPEYSWADDVLSSCQRLLRGLNKHPFHSEINMEGLAAGTVAPAAGGVGLSTACEREARILVDLVHDDLPLRLHQFRCAMEANAVVSKRLYLVKCEYRAPFRAFLEAHQAVQRAPPIELVDKYIALQSQPPPKLKEQQSAVQESLRNCLQTPALVEALALEQQCERLEVDMAHSLFPFTELSRILDHKRARLKPVPGILDSDEIQVLQETVRRFKFLLCRKAGIETSTGIRPLLLDLQGVPREETLLPTEIDPFGPCDDDDDDDSDSMYRLERLIDQLQCLGKLCRNRSGFHLDNSKKGEIDIPASITRACNDLDIELFQAQFEDWCATVKQQRTLSDSTVPDTTGITNIDNNNPNDDGEKIPFVKLSERLRRAEIEVSIAAASEPALRLVRQRLESKENDREKRFEVLKEMVEDVCRREMNLHINLFPPDKHMTLYLPEISATGLFALPLQLAGEPLPE